MHYPAQRLCTFTDKHTHTHSDTHISWRTHTGDEYLRLVTAGHCWSFIDGSYNFIWMQSPLFIIFVWLGRLMFIQKCNFRSMLGHDYLTHSPNIECLPIWNEFSIRFVYILHWLGENVNNWHGRFRFCSSFFIRFVRFSIFNIAFCFVQLSLNRLFCFTRRFFPLVFVPSFFIGHFCVRFHRKTLSPNLFAFCFRVFEGGTGGADGTQGKK